MPANSVPSPAGRGQGEGDTWSPLPPGEGRVRATLGPLSHRERAGRGQRLVPSPAGRGQGEGDERAETMSGFHCHRMLGWQGRATQPFADVGVAVALPPPMAFAAFRRRAMQLPAPTISWPAPRGRLWRGSRPLRWHLLQKPYLLRGFWIAFDSPNRVASSAFPLPPSAVPLPSFRPFSARLVRLQARFSAKGATEGK